jgi:hypothetical protein
LGTVRYAIVTSYHKEERRLIERGIASVRWARWLRVQAGRR